MNMMMKSRLPTSIFDTLPEIFKSHTLGLDHWPDFDVVSTTYPPHNVVRISENKVRLEFALAGFPAEYVNVTVQDGVLVISAETKANMLEEGATYLYKGISTKAFRKSLKLFDYEVIGAEFKNGMLLVELEHVIPESKKPKTIAIKRS